MLRYSIIIPCFNDEQKLKQLLRQIANLPTQPSEVIVVDAAASQACLVICQQCNAHWLASEPCRGKQMLEGAAQAKGDVLWFLHADMRLPKDPLSVMSLSLMNGAIGGYFQFIFDYPRAWPAFILETAIALRCRFGTPYGDQGLFMTKQAYIEAGGHAPWPLFEEVPLVKGLRKIGNFTALDTPLYVDPRRWQRDGWWRRTKENRKLAIAFSCGQDPHDLAKRYQSHITHLNDKNNEV